MNSNPSIKQARTYRRSSSNKMLGGVAGGFGEYFGIDPVLARLGTVLAVLLTGGTAAIAYIALVIVTPTDADADVPAPDSPVATAA